MKLYHYINSGLIYNEAFIWSRRKDLTGVVLRTATLPWEYNMYLKSINGTKFQHIEGLFADVWNDIQTHLNFTYWTVLSVDNKWSYLHPNGTWEGLFGMLQRNEIDVIIGAALSPARTRDFQYVHPITHKQ